MVAPLGPGKFYGSALPRPRFYTDLKFSESRVDPPLSIVDPLLSWAKEAHWSMGGLSFTRLRLQGRIEGNIGKLRAQKEKEFVEEKSRVEDKLMEEEARKEDVREEEERCTPKAPVAHKRRRRLVEDSEDEERGEVEEEFMTENKRKSLKRKLYDEFDAVVRKGDSNDGNSEGRRTSPRTVKNCGTGVMATPKSSKILNGEIEVVHNTNGRLRVSPRLAKLSKDSGCGGNTRVSRRLVKSG